ncbi:MAG: class I SAM-dependent methyltransferase [Anaerolineales bacterium]|nr:class I SAM-dependent methyltransferase [Anaerolineales bacterium]
MKAFINSLVSKMAYFLLPRALRKYIVKIMISAEVSAPPRDAIRWQLGIFDQVSHAIDLQCKRLGNGVHIKHELMDGIHSFFYDRIPKNARVLDLGCGYGAVAHSIAIHAEAQVLGIDFDAGQIAFAKQRFPHPHIRYVVGNVFTDIPETESFDVIVLSSVLEHLENRENFLMDLSQRFHPAKFLIRVPTFERHFFAALKRELGLFPYTDDTHVLEYSPQIFMDEMTKAGLDVRHFEIRWGDIWAECVPVK